MPRSCHRDQRTTPPPSAAQVPRVLHRRPPASVPSQRQPSSARSPNASGRAHRRDPAGRRTSSLLSARGLRAPGSRLPALVRRLTAALFPFTPAGRLNATLLRTAPAHQPVPHVRATEVSRAALVAWMRFVTRTGGSASAKFLKRAFDRTSAATGIALEIRAAEVLPANANCEPERFPTALLHGTLRGDFRRR